MSTYFPLFSVHFSTLGLEATSRNEDPYQVNIAMNIFTILVLSSGLIFRRQTYRIQWGPAAQEVVAGSGSVQIVWRESTKI